MSTDRSKRIRSTVHTATGAEPGHKDPGAKELQTVNPERTDYRGAPHGPGEVKLILTF